MPKQATLIELDAIEAVAKGRPLAIHLAAASLRVLEDYRSVIGDVEDIGLVAATAAGLVSRGVGSAPDGACTLAMIAALSRLDKETARRRVLRLIRGGILHRTRDSRICLNESFFQQPHLVAVLRRHAGSAARLANSFGEHRVLGALEGLDALCLIPIAVPPEHAMPDAAAAMLASIHRSLDAYRQLVGTTARVLIILAVLVITAQHLVKTDLPKGLEDVRVAMPRDRLAPSNLSSIAAAAGLPFETARRKTLELVSRGVLVRGEAGDIQFTHGVLQQPAVYDLVTRNAAEAINLANRLVELGVLIATPAPN